MTSVERFIDSQLARGRAYFSRDEAAAAVVSTPGALGAALGRQVRKGRLISSRQGFYLILRPEDRVFGAPDPARWIDPLMAHLQLDYRISLLRAAAFHGSSHQAAMVFQVIVPRQLRDFEIGRHRLELVYQDLAAFEQVNRTAWLSSLKTEAGFAKMAGVELALLDCARYLRRAGGLQGLTQIVKDLGRLAKPERLARVAEHYENSSVRRLGYLLEHLGHSKPAVALQPFVKRAKSDALLDPSAKTLVIGLTAPRERVSRWKLIVNDEVEADF